MIAWDQLALICLAIGALAYFILLPLFSNLVRSLPLSPRWVHSLWLVRVFDFGWQEVAGSFGVRWHYCRYFLLQH